MLWSWYNIDCLTRSQDGLLGFFFYTCRSKSEAWCLHKLTNLWFLKSFIVFFIIGAGTKMYRKQKWTFTIKLFNIHVHVITAKIVWLKSCNLICWLIMILFQIFSGIQLIWYCHYRYIHACFLVGEALWFLWCPCGALAMGGAICLPAWFLEPVPNLACFLSTSRGGLASDST